MGNQASSIITSTNDRWEVVRKLGQGGMGHTVLVRSLSDAGLAVLKELHLAKLDDWKALELFQREAAILQALDHPGIPRYLDVIDEGDGVQGLLQSFVEGRSLQQMIDGAPVSAARFEAALRDCLDILAYLQGHSPQVVHRDITPANIMLDAERAYVIDFGSVKWALREGAELTSVGTFGYMAPEQLLGRAEPASDMYGLGMSFVALATGRDPSSFEVDPRTGQVDVRAMLRLPAPITNVLVQMTRPGLGDRLSDPKQALRLLDTASGADLTAPPARTRNAVLRAGIVAGAMMVVGVGATVMIGSPSPSQPLPSQPPPPPPVVEQRPEPVAPAVVRPAEPPVVRAPEPAVVRPPAPAVVERERVIGSSTIRFRTQPGGVTVSLPGGLSCVSPCEASVPHGRHSFRFTHAGRTIAREVMVIEDTSLTVSF